MNLTKNSKIDSAFPVKPNRYLDQIWKFYIQLQIRNRIALQFTLIVAVILTVVFSSVFISFSVYRKLNFAASLRERALTAAEVFLSADNVTQEKFHEIQKKYQKSLPGEVIALFDKNNTSVFIEKPTRHYPMEILGRIRTEQELSFQDGMLECYGIYYHDNQGDYVVISSALDAKGRELLRFLFILMSFVFVLSLFGVYFLGRLFAKNALNPISNVIRQVSKMEAHNLHVRVKEGTRKDEIGELAKTFNKLLSRLEKSFEMQKSFVSGASHEFRTPITAMIGKIEVGISKPRSKEEYLQILEETLVQAEKLNEITSSLLSLTKADNEFLRIEPIRLDQLVYDSIENLPKSLMPENIDLRMKNLPEDSSDLIIQANRQLMQMALGNILSNALKFSSGKKVFCTLFQSENQTFIQIEDQGPGIMEEDLNKIFQPFFRGANAQGFEGTGIGLSLSEKIIRMYQGKISVRSKLNEGTHFQISFPLSSPKN